MALTPSSKQYEFQKRRDTKWGYLDELQKFFTNLLRRDERIHDSFCALPTKLLVDVELCYLFTLLGSFVVHLSDLIADRNLLIFSNLLSVGAPKNV